MRRLPVLAVIAALAALTLTGCAPQSSETTCVRAAASPDSPLGTVSVTGDVGSAPTVTIPAPFVADEVSYDDVVTGSGITLDSPSQLVQLDISLYNGATGRSIVDGQYGSSVTPVVSLAQWTTVFPGILTALKCVDEGSRVVMALPPGGLSDAATTSLGIDPSISTVAIIDVDKVYYAKAQGSLVFNDAHDLPTVVRAPDGRPGILVPDTDPPTDVVVQTLIKGDGPAVTDSDTVRVDYTGVLWAGKTVFDTSWDGAPKSFTLDKVVPGFATALRGATVGSQVLVVVPPDQGYGDTETGKIPAGSTLVFVVDILGIDPPGISG